MPIPHKVNVGAEVEHDAFKAQLMRIFRGDLQTSRDRSISGFVSGASIGVGFLIPGWFGLDAFPNMGFLAKCALVVLCGCAYPVFAALSSRPHQLTTLRLTNSKPEKH